LISITESDIAKKFTGIGATYCSLSVATLFWLRDRNYVLLSMIIITWETFWFHVI